MIIASNQGGFGLSKESKRYEGRKIVLILGAGCTYNEGIKGKEPPLDKGFFQIANRTNKSDVEPIRRYFVDYYNLDICSGDQRPYDSLEYVMVRLFADANALSMGKVAYEIFLSLIKLFNKRLADTTNRVKPHPRSSLFKLIVNFLNEGAKPKDICIITFNQDIQIEKTLDAIEIYDKYQQFKPLLNFPYCYLPSSDYMIEPDRITGPKNSTATFAKGDSEEQGIQILKLHGSLNWYSAHGSKNVDIDELFDPDKRLQFTRRRTIHPEMRYGSGERRQYTFPIIVPPVSHKSAIFHSTISRSWPGAEERLQNANDVVIFGYSCPETDHESSNLIQRTLGSRKLETFSIIDPSPEVFTRFWELTRQERVFYYSSVDSFLRAD